MEDKEKSQESTEYVPRYVQQNKEVKRSSYLQFKEWAHNKLQYKMFRIKIINEVRKANIKGEKLDFVTLETMAPLLMLNAFGITLWLSRKEGLFRMVAKSVGICAFTYLAVTFYGEERVFYQNCIRDDVIGYYLRARYTQEMKEHKYFETFQDMNENFMKKYNIPPREKIQEAFKEIELNLSK